MKFPLDIVPNKLGIALFCLLLLALLAFVILKWKYITETLSGDEKSPSSKRLIIFLFSLVVVIIALAAVFLNKSVPEFIWDGLLVVISAGMGLNAFISAYRKPIQKGSDTDTPT